MLLLKRHLVELVRRGKKRQTIRLWSKPLLRVGQISYTPGLGKMKITAIDQLPSLNALTEADAKADGFDSLAALKAEIKKIYGPDISRILNAPRPTTPPRRIYRIQFDWPIDDAGKKLILRDAPAPKPAPRATHSTIKPPAPPAPPKLPTPQNTRTARRSTRMTARQQQLLREFVVAKHPHRKPSPR